MALLVSAGIHSVTLPPVQIATPGMALARHLAIFNPRFFTEAALDLNHLYLDKLCARLQCWDAEIRRWNVQAATAAAEEQPRLTEHLRAVCEKRDLVHECLAQLRSASGTAWHIIKTGMEAAWCELTQAIEQTAMVFDT